ncbi:putative crooked neck family 1 protein isoform 2 [Cryptosporidium felis]|nr:putative crooked neck family 1 protein isoform 2 [Cryptosporidium felis]
MKNVNPDIKNYISTYHKGHSLARLSNIPENNVKNKSSAPIQITVEQILKESYLGSADISGNLSKLYESFNFKDIDELEDYRIRKRKEFEDSIRRKRWKMGIYISYAKWESLQNNFDNSRSILERALIINYENCRIWREYIKLEIINGNINNARNLFERVTKLLPRIDEFWTKYTQMEFVLKNYLNVRHIYKNWINTKPSSKVYIQFSKFEEECGEIENARTIMQDLISTYPSETNYFAYIKFEQSHNKFLSARQIIDFVLHSNNKVEITDKFFSFLADIFIEMKKYGEAIKVCNEGIKYLEETHYIESLKEKLFQLYKIGIHERPDDNLEWIIYKSQQYQSKLSSSPIDFDLLFDYSLFISQYFELNSAMEIYEALLINAPINNILNLEKYLYSNLLFAHIFETRTKNNFSNIHKIINHFIMIIKTSKLLNTDGSELVVSSEEFDLSHIDHRIILSNIFKYFSDYLVRSGDIFSARRILGIGLGRAPCKNLFDQYIDLEFKLGNFDRCRVLFIKYIEFDPISSKTWVQFIQFEFKLKEVSRAISIAEAAISMPELDYPEIVWQFYIEIMINMNNLTHANNIYRRLLEKTQHVQAVMNYSSFIVSKLNDIALNRKFILEMLSIYKEKGMDYQRSLIIKYWLSLEESFIINDKDNESKLWVKIISKLIPKVVTNTDLKKKTYNFDEDNYDMEYLLSLETDHKLENTNGLFDSVPTSLIDAAKQWKKIKL